MLAVGGHMLNVAVCGHMLNIVSMKTDVTTYKQNGSPTLELLGGFTNFEACV